jgi:beta-glucosidase
MSGEARSRSSLDLPGVQEGLARSLKATGKPLVVVLFCGRPLSINWLAEHASSILLAWFPGVEAGHAIADVLLGAYNPAGRLPVSFPRTVGQIPIYYNHKNTGRPDLDESRAAKAGDQNASKYLDIPSTPLYPFGHGLSYTTFAYQELQLSSSRIRAHDKLRVQVEVINTADLGGDEVVQLYVQDLVASVTRPVKELRRFKRIHLAPGEQQTVTFEIRPEDLAFLGLDMRPIVEPGTFTVFVGGSSTSLIQGTFEVEGPSLRL